MGKIIGIVVKKQQGESYLHPGYPRKPIDELAEQFRAFLQARFPLAQGDYGASVQKNIIHGDDYDMEFWIQPYKYGEYFDLRGYGDNNDVLYLAMVEFIFSKFSHIEGIEMKTFWSG